jgi:hypothetical protein
MEFKSVEPKKTPTTEELVYELINVTGCSKQLAYEGLNISCFDLTNTLNYIHKYK